MRVLGSCSAEETYNIAKDMGEAAKEGEVVTLTGDLGTGKTVFAKGFAGFVNNVIFFVSYPQCLNQCVVVGNYVGQTLLLMLKHIMVDYVLSHLHKRSNCFTFNI